LQIDDWYLFCGCLLCFALLLLFSAGAVERAEGEVAEDERDQSVDDEMLMVGAGSPGVAEPPGVLGEEEAEDGEEEAGNFEPENSASVGEGSPDGLAEFAGSTGDASASLGPALGIGRSILLHGMSGLRGAVAKYAGGNADAYAQFAAKTIRFHK
jgi:hypothetical protein